MGELREGPVIATIGDAVILWETSFKYQVCYHCFITSHKLTFIIIIIIINHCCLSKYQSKTPSKLI